MLVMGKYPEVTFKPADITMVNSEFFGYHVKFGAYHKVSRGYHNEYVEREGSAYLVMPLLFATDFATVMSERFTDFSMEKEGHVDVWVPQDSKSAYCLEYDGHSFDVFTDQSTVAHLSDFFKKCVIHEDCYGPGNVVPAPHNNEWLQSRMFKDGVYVGPEHCPFHLTLAPGTVCIRGLDYVRSLDISRTYDLVRTSCRLVLTHSSRITANISSANALNGVASHNHDLNREPGCPPRIEVALRIVGGYYLGLTEYLTEKQSIRAMDLHEVLEKFSTDPRGYLEPAYLSRIQAG